MLIPVVVYVKIYFVLRLNKIPLYVYITLSHFDIHPFISVHLGCLHASAIMSSATLNMDG
jgi:hypothetical protein